MYCRIVKIELYNRVPQLTAAGGFLCSRKLSERKNIPIYFGLDIKYVGTDFLVGFFSKLFEFNKSVIKYCSHLIDT